MKKFVKSMVILMTIVNIEVCRGVESDDCENRFPDDFIFGSSTSSYQIEGAWNVDNKGESIWDRMTHSNPSRIADGSNGDIADNSYYLYKTDIDLIKQIGANAYRISISWPRILPNGLIDYINVEGIEYYNNVINEMLSRNVTPFVTIYHWELPQKLQDLGGWENPKIVDWFVDYARVVFNEFGDRVKHWMTLNEPNIFCILGYNGIFAPGLNKSGQGDYACGHNALLAHAKTYRMYQEEFYEKQKGTVGIVVAISWPVPENPDDPEEVAGAEMSKNFWNYWILHPLFSSEGDYPKSMKDRIANYSSIQGFSSSRLPEFTTGQIELVKKSADFLGVNFYSARFEKKLTNYDVKNTVSFYGDIGMISTSKTFPKDRCTPWAMSDAIKTMNEELMIPKMLITENGIYDHGGLNDVNRAEYYYLHLNETLKLLNEGFNIRGYFAWSLLDNFEWSDGYTQKYGIFSIDYTDPERTRTPKFSSEIITEIFKTKIVSDTFLINGKVTPI
ncbi:myrosinase 1-like [Microplitis mediator]|uniref:myrosinase 1-like n=1 Tax=Microplitis mediator TaxID=375433 RepID=UPI0025579546|nr:myrosinase 1-like [Microplitis mediator]XP_057330130.1 myrosinase 1-like [Microplitis mediator]XP_057330131.1 myrosinase 1-like [Microplitis mediator]